MEKNSFYNLANSFGGEFPNCVVLLGVVWTDQPPKYDIFKVAKIQKATQRQTLPE